MEPPTVLSTERLVLRAPEPGDGAEINAAIRETWEDLHAWMDWAREVPSVRETEERVQGAALRFRRGEEFTYYATLRESGEIAVVLSLRPRDLAVPSYSFGYWARASCQGRGYVTEATRAIVEVTFGPLRAERVEATCDVRNVRSCRVLERAGFLLEGVLRYECRDAQGGLRDTCVYARTK